MLVGKKIVNPEEDQESNNPVSSPVLGRTRAQLLKIQAPL